MLSVVMEIEDLRRIAVLAEHERITDAAAALFITQPTLSRLLTRVEHELGTRLFERDAHGARPNPYGELAVAAAREIADRYDRLRSDLANLLDPDSGTVRLAFLDSMATSLVPRILRGFRAAAPRVGVVLRQEPSHEILRDLASGAAELGITSLRPDKAHGWLRLERQRLLLVVPPGHRLAQRRQVRLEEIRNEDLVTVPAGFGFRSQVDELFAAAGVPPRVSFESSDLATVEGLVAAGLGVALLPEQFAGVSGTVGVPLAGQGVERIVGLTWRTDRPLAPAAARMLAWLHDAIPLD
jgi:DNA-binding transcriptional LysR family regulator